MREVTSDEFGELVIHGKLTGGGQRRTGVSAMIPTLWGVPAETVETYPSLLLPALQFAAALAFHELRAGRWGEVEKVAPERFGALALDIADKKIIPQCDDLRNSGWLGNTSLRGIFTEACSTALAAVR